MNKEDIRELAEYNAIYEFNKFKKIYGNYTDEYVRHFYNKLAELRGGLDDVYACNCRHNSNSKDNEPCCGCNSGQTNADRIRNMSDEELAMFIGNLAKCTSCDLQCSESSTTIDECCRKHLKWLQSEAE